MADQPTGAPSAATPGGGSGPIWRTDRRAKWVIVAFLAVAVQVVALVVAAATGLVSLRDDDPNTHTATIVGIAVVALGCAAVLGLLARALAAGRPWVRGPLLTIEMLAAFVGSVLREEIGWILAAVISVPALVAVLVLFSPAVGEALTDERRRLGAFPDDDGDDN